MRKSTSKEIKVLEPITPQQQTFIEALLQGKNISEAAIIAGISRRTASYWLNDPEHQVYLEYEKQRLTQQQNFTSRIATIHEAALQAIEASLSEEAPLPLRLKAAQFIYQTHLQQVCNVRQARQPFSLVKDEGDAMSNREHFENFGSYHLNRLPD
jgi:transposase